MRGRSQIEQEGDCVFRPKAQRSFALVLAASMVLCFHANGLGRAAGAEAEEAPAAGGDEGGASAAQGADVLVFAYGTLLDERVQRRIIGRPVPSLPDTLVGYSKAALRLRHGVYAIAVPDDAGRIEGGVLHVTPRELELMDLYEGPQYERVQVELASGKKAWVYRVPERRAPSSQQS